MRVLVTGAGGFLGRHVVRALVRRGHEVVALVRPSRVVPSDRFPEGVRIARGDLRVRDGLAGALDGVEAVVHLAANVTGDEDSQFSDTVVGTENLLAAMAEAGVANLIHCSTFSVYDWRSAGGVLDEQTPLEADLYGRDGYAITKSWQERIVRRAAEQHGWRLVVLRPGFVWGGGNEFVSGVGHPLGPLRLVFGPSRPLPITYVENCAGCFAEAVDSPNAGGAIVNIVDPEPISAWKHEGDALRATGERGWRVPIPYTAGLVVAAVATWISKRVYGGRGKLPGILMPNRFRARFRPLRFSREQAEQVFAEPPGHTYRDAWRRVSAAKKSAASGLDGPDADATDATDAGASAGAPDQVAGGALARG